LMNDAGRLNPELAVMGDRQKRDRGRHWKDR
jgi:hypothetical protein